MPTLNIKSTQQAIKVGEHKGEEMFVMRVEHYPVAAIRHLIRELPEQRELSEARFKVEELDEVNYAESRPKKMIIK